MQFSTTPTLEGQPITEYCGVVTGEAILGEQLLGSAENAVLGREMGGPAHWSPG